MLRERHTAARPAFRIFTLPDHMEVPMRSVLLLLLFLLLPSALWPQSATRLGVYEGMGFTGITYNFFGREHDREIESMAHIGFELDIPLSRRVILAFRPALTTLNDNAGLAARVTTDEGSVYYRGDISEQWIIELQLLAKVVFEDEEFRPYVAGGAFVDINSNPAEVRPTVNGVASGLPGESFSSLIGGLVLAGGVEIRAAHMLIITPEFAVRQPLTPLVDGDYLTQNNNPRFLFSVGILFPLSYERW